MRKFVLFAIICLLLALPVTTVYAAPPPDGPPGLERAIAVQEANNPRLLTTPGITGTAVGLTVDGKPAIKIFTERAGVPRLPLFLDGIPVVVQVTGKFAALKPPEGKGPPDGKGPKNKEPATTDRWDRPVPIGISTGNRLECIAGTIGARVTDGDTLYALSNNHVYARENKATYGENGEEVLQPGLYDTGCVYDPANHLGNLWAFVPLNFNDYSHPNTVDAAIAVTDNTLLRNSTPDSGYGTPKTDTQAAFLGMAVQKFGRTTKLTKGTVTGINASLIVGYDSGDAYFVNQIVVESRKPFIKSGDSGSLLVSHPYNYPVGLLFAGNPTGKLAIANHIGEVLDKLGVTIDGE
jgi:hypothetical protein